MERFDQMRTSQKDVMNYALGHVWHNVAPEDQRRIGCQKPDCESPATICQHIGQRNGVSFAYWCEVHGSMWRERLPEFDATSPANRLFTDILDGQHNASPNSSRPTRIQTPPNPACDGRIFDTIKLFDREFGDVLYVTGPAGSYRSGMVLDCYYPTLDTHIGVIRVTFVSDPTKDSRRANAITFDDVEGESAPKSYPDGMIVVSRLRRQL